MMDNLTQTQQKIVVGVIAAVGSAVVVTVLVVAALLLRRKIKDKKRTKYVHLSTKGLKSRSKGY